jgi:deoxyribodipyrimidine photo-lyase
MTTLVHFDNDLRVADNAALSAAAARGDVVGLYVLDDETAGSWRRGGASRWWLHHALVDLRASLAAFGVPLLVARGAADVVVPDVARRVGADAVFWQQRFEPWARSRDHRTAQVLRGAGAEVRTWAGFLLHDVEAVRTQGGAPFTVFTPFWKSASAGLRVGALLPVPSALRGATIDEEPAPIESLGLLPRIAWDAGLRETWQATEAAGHARLQEVCLRVAGQYHATRNLPGVDGTSRLSPWLHFGQLSPRQVWDAVSDAAPAESPHAKGAGALLREVGWRDFSWHVLHHHPHTTDAPLRSHWSAFPWEHDAALVRAWERGETGYPLVDAGMRQLWHTGWMHNRLRMVVASFLTKHLLQHWEHGARWFWDTLVDADAGNNTMGWQWAAGCGADAQPFFRIFNPVSQGEKFDPDGAFVRRWVPELAHIEGPGIHAPWALPALVLHAAGVRLGETYPAPIVDHATARARALDAAASMRGERPVVREV